MALEIGINFFLCKHLPNDFKFATLINRGKEKAQAGIAQSVEQRTENPRVTSSSLVPGISLKPLKLTGFKGFIFLILTKIELRFYF